MGKKTIIILSLSGIMVFSLLMFKKDSQTGHDAQEQNKAMIETGRHLFFDTRLSYNNTRSCGSCHDPKFAFTDGYRRSITANGDNVKHNAPSLVNISFQNYFDWANPGVTTLEKQHERPLFNEHPAELGAKGNETLILKRIKADTGYQKKFAEAFPGVKEPISFSTIISSIAAFVRTLQSSNSPYDKFIKGDTAVMSLSAKAGMALFFSARLNCSSCHTAPLFTLATITKNKDSIYLNTGLYNVLNKNKYPEDDNGLQTFTNNPADNGKFKIPSLRNVALTAPYMHDGSINTLEEVIDMYTNGGRQITAGPSAGDGKNNNLKDKRIKGFVLLPVERKQLLDFLFSLTDSAVLTRPAFQNPFSLNNK